jgi:hypothetical protein
MLVYFLIGLALACAFAYREITNPSLTRITKPYRQGEADGETLLFAGAGLFFLWPLLLPVLLTVRAAKAKAAKAAKEPKRGK